MTKQEMTVVRAYPPIYAQIQKAFPHIRGTEVVFCWGEKIFNPSGKHVEEHVVIHELVHRKQQGNDPEAWWLRYISDAKFRLEQEVPAYAAQYAYAKPMLNVKGQRIFLETIAEQLSGDMYGGMITFAKAESMIRIEAEKLLSPSKI
jgi:hypothetical protein